jgi:hypothetical protein
MKRGLLWSVVATFCGVVGSLFVTPLLVARLGPGEFGLFVLVLTLASCASFFDLGLTWAAGRYLADDFASGRRRDLAGRFFTLARFLAGVGLLSVACAVVVGPAIVRASGADGRGPILVALVLAAVSFALTLQIGLLGTLLRSCQRFDEAGRVNTIDSVLLPLGSHLAVSAAASLNLLLAVNVLVNGVVLTLYVLRGRNELDGSEPTARWAPHYLREMAAFGGWTMSTRVCIGTMCWRPTREAAVRLLERVAPLVQARVPAARLVIGGWDAKRWLQGCQFPRGAEIFENLPDAEEFYRRLSCMVYPADLGSGMKVKVLESFAYGVPVVSSPVGLEGLEARADEHLLVGENDADIAAAVVRMLQDSELRCVLRRNGRALVEQHYVPDAVVPRIEAMYDAILRSQ